MAKKQFSYVFVGLLMLFLNACSVKIIRPTLSPTSRNGTITKPEESKPVESTPPGKSDEGEITASPINSTASSGTSTVIPKFGFIFSGGGAKAWAHIGVLKELQKLKWPINSVAGFEWGAPVAAVYAQNLSANEVEWELSKLKDFDKWDPFIKAVFSRKMTADLKIPFVCPSINVAKQSIYLLNRGQMDQLVPFCIASPGILRPINQSMALMTDVSSLAQHLRATGATRIILINAMAQSTKRSFVKDWESGENVLWVQSAALMSKKPNGVDDVVEINLDNFGIKDLDRRREIIAKGSELSYPQLKKLAEKYGL